MDWNKVIDNVLNYVKPSRLENEIKGMKYESELITRLSQNQEVMKYIDCWLQDYYDTIDERKEDKCSKKSLSFKIQGTKQFQLKKYAESLEFYTKSARYADSYTDSSLAIANRSAALFHMSRWQKCIDDIKLALELDYPENLRFKLYLRAVQCYLELGNKSSALETILKLRNSVNQGKMSNEKKEQLQKQINVLTSKISCLEDETDNTTDNTTDTTEFPSPPEVVYGENPNFPSASAAVEIKHAPEKGRYVVANRDIKRGQILFVEEAFVFVPLSFAKSDICYNCCRSSGDTPLPCTECIESIYCNINCWNEARSSYHRWECVGNQMGLWDEVGIAYLAVRMLFKCTTTTDGNKLKEVQDLVTNFSKVSPSDIISYGITAIMLRMYLSKFTPFFTFLNLDECSKFYDFNCDLATENGRRLFVSSLLLRNILQLISNGHAITKINAIANNKNTLFIQQQDRIATAIYPSASMMNHSCDPNIINSFLGHILITKATRDIAAGEEVFNCYGVDFRRMLRQQRQEKMKSQYCFKCNCVACTKPEYEDSLRKFIAKKCPKCSGPLSDNFYSSSMHCMDCGAAMYGNIYDESLKDADSYYSEGRVCIENENYDEALIKLKACLHLKRAALYKYHEDLAEIMDLIARVYAIMEQWLNSISYLEHSIVAIEERYGSCSLEVCNEINKLTDICMQYLQEESNTSSKYYKNVLKKTRRYLNRAEEIINLTCGPWNEVYREIAVKKEILSSILINFNV